MTAPTTADSRTIAAVRHFTRFFTRRIGVLRRRLYASPFSLVEARVLYEIANRPGTSAGEVARDLGLDPGQLSRTLEGLVRRGLVRRRRAAADARRHALTATPRGVAAFAALDRASREEVAALLASLDADGRDRLAASLAAAERLLEPARLSAGEFVLRPHAIGDMGMITAAQARLYAREYGWNGEFEALVAEIAAKFIREFDPAREHCWIVERRGEIAGSIFLVKESESVAKIRLVYLESWARGAGLGRRMLDECLAFAHDKGYAKVVLWTNDCLVDARRLYERAGFVLVRSEAHHSFGKDLVGQYWSLDLAAR
ncbi:MAG: MarR family transcriptional regulator [Rhodospirillales bacterium]|nr:MarR family transcriptional regulator [Rhodospirillales bacterium]